MSGVDSKASEPKPQLNLAVVSKPRHRHVYDTLLEEITGRSFSARRSQFPPKPSSPRLFQHRARRLPAPCAT